MVLSGHETMSSDGFNALDFFGSHLQLHLTGGSKPARWGFLSWGWKGLVPWYNARDDKMEGLNTRGERTFTVACPLERVGCPPLATDQSHSGKYRFIPAAWCALRPYLEAYRLTARCQEDRAALIQCFSPAHR